MQHSGHCDKAGAGGYNETTFVQTMEALVSTGLDKLGYVYLNADDCWIAENRELFHSSPPYSLFRAQLPLIKLLTCGIHLRYIHIYTHILVTVGTADGKLTHDLSRYGSFR